MRRSQDDGEIERVVMKERGILFSGEMVRAILDGRKTQTRRIVKPQPNDDVGEILVGNYFPTVLDKWGDEEPGEEIFGAYSVDGSWGCKFPFGMLGDIIHCIQLKPIPSLLRTHAAGDDGHIYRIDKGNTRPLKEQISNGYRRISVCAGSEKIRTAHELVCEAFYGEKTNHRLEVRHLDGDRGNNKPENLDWGTPEQNWADRHAHGNGVHEKHHNAKINMSIAETMRESGKTAWLLAKEYGLSSKTVSNVLNNRTWIKKCAPPPNLPRWASRINLEITGVHVERLNEISEKDAWAEGCFSSGWEPSYGNPDNAMGEESKSAKEEFADLWESINGAGSWDKNPWVWCISFRRI